MREKKIRPVLAVGAMLFLILAILAETVYFSDFEYFLSTKRFNRVLWKKEKILEECLNGIKPVLSSTEGHTVPKTENRLFGLAGRHGITILEYVDGRLVYWSDNEFDVPHVADAGFFSKPLIQIQNGWFLAKTVRSDNELVVGLLRISYNYGFENNIIKNGFAKGFRLPENTRIDTASGNSGYLVFNKSGSPLFSLVYPETRGTTMFFLMPLLLWSVVLVFTVLLALGIVRALVSDRKTISAITACLLIFAFVYFVILITGKPSSVTNTELFSPYRYTMNSLVPSLGHLLLLSFFLAVTAFVFYRYCNPADHNRKSGRNSFIHLTGTFIPGVLIYALYHKIFGHLIFNSTINFETYKVLDLDVFSFAGFLSLVLFQLAPFFYLLKVIKSNRDVPLRSLVLTVLASSLVLVVFTFREPVLMIALWIFYILTATFVWFSCNRKITTFNMTVICSAISGLYFLTVISVLSVKKTTENIKIQLVAYSTENDPEAEHLLLDMWPRISNDTLLERLMKVDYFESSDFDSISDYLSDTYFSGYWGNFNFNIVLCGKNDSIRLGDRSGRYEDCFGFFENRILRDGVRLTGTDFYFIDNQQGRSNYLCRLFYMNNDGSINGLFIDLYSDINIFHPGYSELLLDKKYHGYAKLKDYSFAKYINGDIVFRTGEFPYDKSDARYEHQETDYTIFKVGGFRHVLYKNGNVTVIISRPELTAGDLVISFAYLFAIIFICSNLLLLFIRRPKFKSPYNLNFRQKLQMAFIGVFLISFALIGTVFIKFAISEYKIRHYSNIREKLNSIYVELENRISMEEQLSSGVNNINDSYLNEVLIRLSNSFNTDINLYDLNGYLISTSRPEIYLRNLTSRRMNDIAFLNLDNFKRSEFFQNEKIGSLEYISAYTPFYNAQDKLLVYLNLPYFRMQSALAREVSNMIVAVINFTLLLIVITMGLAVFISSRLTAPLTMLESGLASVELGKKIKHLSYKSNDEVGDLVKQYNRMVDELDESAKKLADSEREYAWREMAKQIAHEIKNPLTPMKLNVQHLYKSWKDGVRDFENRLERFTKSQIEYIDNLSSIASEFSSFAKMPAANPSRVNLAAQIRTTIELFKDTANTTFKLTCSHDSGIYVNADKEHINGIFSNLIQNSIQAIPPGRKGLIHVNLEINDRKVIVSVADNGTGIPESIRKKMFTPNFTTKSSGTGLGLSIVKKYVENAFGSIWFESETDKGSVFYVEFPIAQDIKL